MWKGADFCNFRIQSLLTLEEKLKLDSVDTWMDFYNRILDLKEQTVSFIKSEKKDFLGSLEILFEIEKLAPVSAQTLGEIGYVLNQLGKFNEALSLYQKAHDLSIKCTSQRPFQASALRGIGFSLIELERLDEAERVFKESLELEPMSRVASNELKYIQSLRN